MKNSFQLIDTAEQLQAFCNPLHDVDWIALDTEFLREKTYYPKLCLLQIATPDVTACIDPLAIDDLSALEALLYNASVTKVMHAGRQDLEIFYLQYGKLPTPLFDTQVAAPLIGLDEQLGYGNLVKEMLGVTLDKSHARADWTRRPLPDKQLQYAAEDVIYLAQLYPMLKQKLENHGRLDWLQEDFDLLASPELYENPPEDAWLRVKQAHRLRPAQLAVLQALAEWREATAQQKDLPRNWLCKDDALIDIARQMPNSLSDLGHIRSINEGFVKRYGNTVLALSQTHREDTPKPLPEYQRREKPGPEENAVIDALMSVVNLRAAEASLHPNVIATRKQLENLVSGETDIPQFQGWRKQLVGNDLEALLNGRCTLSIKKGKVVLT